MWKKTLAGYINSVIMLMSVVKYMKIKLIQKRTDLSFDERLIVHNGEAFLKKDNKTMYIEYVDNDGAKVEVMAEEDKLSITRGGENRSELVYIPKQKTDGKIISEYGVLPIELYTHKYIMNHNVISIEYDIVISGEITDRFRMIWNIKEDLGA